MVVTEVDSNGGGDSGRWRWMQELSAHGVNPIAL
jgi:hypothetical protein